MDHDKWLLAVLTQIRDFRINVGGAKNLVDLIVKGYLLNQLTESDIYDIIDIDVKCFAKLLLNNLDNYSPFPLFMAITWTCNFNNLPSSQFYKLYQWLSYHRNFDKHCIIPGDVYLEQEKKFETISLLAEHIPVTGLPEMITDMLEYKSLSFPIQTPPYEIYNFTQPIINFKIHKATLTSILIYQNIFYKFEPETKADFNIEVISHSLNFLLFTSGSAVLRYSI
jgi:hypothetical protein